MTKQSSSQKIPSWIGKKLNNRYKIEKLLGRGGMSTVYKATDPNLKRTVAVKIIHPHLTDSPEFVQRFEQEASAVAQLRHNNIVQVYDFDSYGDVYYMVMEYVTGELLSDKLSALNEAGLRLPLADTIRIVATICDAIDYAHQRRLIHRDLKPANIMLNLLGEPILMDFGLAKIIGGNIHTNTGAMIGTAAYMSPEQVHGNADLRSDIYALGIILYEMLSGAPPFRSDSTHKVMQKHVSEPVPDIRQVNANTPHSLVAIIEKALAKEPANRFQTAAEMANALRTTAVHVQSPVDTLAARHLDRLSTLWQGAQDLLDERKYAACLEKLDELKRADADYKHDQVTQLRRNAQNQFFIRAMKLYQSGKLQESAKAAQALRHHAPEYPGLEHLEVQIQQGMVREEGQTRLSKLYEEAVRCLDNHQYDQALKQWQTIQTKPAGTAYKDRLQVEKRAKQGIAGSLYAEAMAALGSGSVPQALALWQQVQDYDPTFPDKQNLAARAAAMQRDKQKKQALYTKLGIGAALIVVLGLIGWLFFGNNGGRDEIQIAALTETAVSLAAMPTNTPLPTDTYTPTATAVPTQTPTSQPTATPSPPATPTAELTQTPQPSDTALVTSPSSLFTKPDTASTEVAILRVGDEVTVIGRSSNSNWYYVRDEDGNTGYIFNDLVHWEGNVAELNVVYPRLTPETSPTAAESSAETPLKLNLWGLPGTVACGTGGNWSEYIFIEGVGGSGVYTYYWNGQKVGGPTSDDFSFPVSGSAGPIQGTGKVVSGSQSQSKELFLPHPDC